jgi:uncharacterized protein (DUF58 family)
VSPARTQAAVGPRRSGARGEGLELAEVRPWVPGDHARRLHWRATARRGEPFVAERHPERAADVLIFVDTFADLPSHPPGRARSRWPCEPASGLAEAHLRARDRVGVVTFGGVLNWLAPGAGIGHALRITDALASSEVFMSYVAHDVAMVPPAILPARALVIAITPAARRARRARPGRPLRPRPRHDGDRDRRARAAGAAAATRSPACGCCAARPCARA